MKTRTITACFFSSIMLVALLNGPYVFTASFLLLSLCCLGEFYKLIKAANFFPNQVQGIIMGSFLFCASALHRFISFDVRWLWLIIIPFYAIFITELFFRKTNQPFSNIAYTLLGPLYAVVPFCFFHALAFVQGTYNFHFSLGFLLLLWTHDTSAYLIGRRFGKAKLFQSVSPNKTWEGFISGIFASMLLSLVLYRYFPELKWQQWLSVAILIAGLSTLGDLMESLLKRSLHIKDSGKLLPGHGGLLDRFDGFLFATPGVFLYLSLIFDSLL